MSKKYKQLEDHIINTFNRDKRFNINNKVYSVIFATKPRPSTGECKTDVYVLFKEEETEDYYELKISVKRRSNNEFQENKVTAGKAESYFGLDWTNII